MESAVRQIKIIRVGPDGTGTAADDELISEKTVSLYVDGRYDHAAVITGGGEKLWAAGNLKCRGLISSADDIEDISVNDNIIGVRLKRRRVPLKPAPLSVEWQVGPELVRQKIAELAQAKLYLRTGCLHVALLSSNTNPRRSICQRARLMELQATAIWPCVPRKGIFITSKPAPTKVAF